MPERANHRRKAVTGEGGCGERHRRHDHGWPPPVSQYLERQVQDQGRTSIGPVSKQTASKPSPPHTLCYGLVVKWVSLGKAGPASAEIGTCNAPQRCQTRMQHLLLQRHRTDSKPITCAGTPSNVGIGGMCK